MVPVTVAINRVASGTITHFAMPPLHEGWFRHEFYGYRALAADLRRHFADSLKSTIERNGKGKPITDYSLPTSRKLFLLLERPVTGPKSTTVKSVMMGGVNTFREGAAYRSAVEVAMVDKYRTFVKSYVDRVVKTPKLAETLPRRYQTPDVYRAAIDHAEATYESSSFSMSTHVSLPSDGGLPQQQRVTYRIPLRKLYSDTNRLEQLAF